MQYVNFERVERQVRLIQDELVGAALTQPDLWPRVLPWLGGYELDVLNIEGLLKYVRSADEGWTPTRFVDHGIQRLERIFL